MTSHRAPAEIQNPQAYEAAKQARIRMNANTSRRRALEATLKADGDSAEFCNWLFGRMSDELYALSVASNDELDKVGDTENWGPAYTAYQSAMKTYYARVGSRPEFIMDALNNWGGLTPKQLDFARQAFARNIERAEGRDEKEAARKATAQPWVAGRQEVTGVWQSVKLVENDFGGAWKGLILTADGRKLWTTIPARLVDVCTLGHDAQGLESLKGQAVTMKVTIELSKDDATMAFGKRPK